MKISTLMPAHNAAEWITEAIQSALAQTHSDLELLIYDDHSTDDTLAVAQFAARGDARVKVWAAEGERNCSYARNFLYQKAQGEVIFHLDADDTCSPSRVERQLKHLLETDLVFNCTYLEAGAEIWKQSITALDGLKRMATNQKAFAGNSCAYRRILHERNIWHDTRWEWGLDVLFEARIMAEFYPRLGTLAEPLYKYRLHPQQYCRQVMEGRVGLAADYYATMSKEMHMVLDAICLRELGALPKL